MKKILLDFAKRMLSREFILLIAATCMLVFGFIPAEIWLTCALAFIGVRTLLKYKEIVGAKQ